jgi:hypothetical protein
MDADPLIVNQPASPKVSEMIKRTDLQIFPGECFGAKARRTNTEHSQNWSLNDVLEINRPEFTKALDRCYLQATSPRRLWKLFLSAREQLGEIFGVSLTKMRE